MTWIAIIGAFLLIYGRLSADANMDPISTRVGIVMYYASYALFAFLFLVSLIGGIEQVGK